MALCTPVIRTRVAGTPWRSLAYVQEHTGKGITRVGERRMPGRSKH